MGNNATGGKRKNKTRVFRFISQQGRTSKLEIVSRLGISLPTVLQTLKGTDRGRPDLGNGRV